MQKKPLNGNCVTLKQYKNFLARHKLFEDRDYDVAHYQVGPEKFFDDIILRDRTLLQTYPDIEYNESFNEKGINIKVVTNHYEHTYLNFINVSELKAIAVDRNSALTDILAEEAENYTRNPNLRKDAPYVHQEVECDYKGKHLHFRQYMLVSSRDEAIIGFESIIDSEYDEEEIIQIILDHRKDENNE